MMGQNHFVSFENVNKQTQRIPSDFHEPSQAGMLSPSIESFQTQHCFDDAIFAELKERVESHRTLVHLRI